MDNRSLLGAVFGDGRFLLSLTGIALFFSGGFAIAQSASGHFLPHDSHALGMTAGDLARAGNPRLVSFMFHDRVAFGGTLLAIGSAYWWLAEFPLREGAAWAWWTFLLSGVAGFAAFLSYLGYGYLDTWHGAATLLLLPTFAAGLWLSARRQLIEPPSWQTLWRRNLQPVPAPARRGRAILLLCGFGLCTAGSTILLVGMSRIFVPQDITFIGLSRAQMEGISPALVPVIAHDRAGFGGGLVATGILVMLIAWHAQMSRSFVEVMLLMGLFGFGAALGVHVAIGYMDWTHLAPAYFAAGLFLYGVGCCATAIRCANRETIETDGQRLGEQIRGVAAGSGRRAAPRGGTGR